MKNVKNKLIELKDELQLKKNSSAEFFENLIATIDKNPKEAIESILRSYSIVQYGNFSPTEEKLFDEIWQLADILSKENGV